MISASAGSAASETIEFDEFDRRGRLVTLSWEGAQHLSQTGLVEVLPAGRDTWRLIPCGSVGSVRVEGLSVRVLPAANLGLTQLFFLLDHAADNAFLPSAVAARDDDELWVSVAESMAALAHQALSSGLLRGYRRVDEALTTVRGRIRLGDQIRRHPGMTIPLEVTYSEFTPDIAENRILRTAAHRLQFLPDLPDATRRRLAMVDARLADATLIGQGAPVPAWTRTRLNARFQNALALADRIVRRISVEVEDGHAASAAFVTEMPALFERFVEAELTAALDGCGGRVLQNPVVHLDTGIEQGEAGDAGSSKTAGGRPGRHSAPATDGDHISVPTGLVYEVDGEPVTTFVPTYPTDRRARAAEHYRLLAACTALGVDRAYLVYPAQRRDDTPQPRRIVHTDISIVEYPVDLSMGPLESRRTIVELSQQARELAVPSPARHRTGGRRHAR
ncbi:5-methylcytosine-specific restriction enzyme subunit McrC [Dietzia sp. 2505]|uniref:McrC family protein n=1 Tax=Dietzia sp. 2505 TaxID=3156457 RepID=UPI00339563CF